MSVIIDGVDLTKDLGLKVLADTSDEMLPDVQNYSVNIPGRHGDYSFKSWMQPRKFSIDLLIPPQASRMDVQVIAREFNRLLLDRFGNPKEVTLSFDFEPDKHYNVKLTSSIDIERKLRMGFFTAEFTAYDPFAYSNVYADEITWGSEEITFEYQYLLGHEGIGGSVKVTSPTTITDVYVEGYAVKPIFEIRGSASSLTVSANGHSFSLPTFSNASWTIDCEKYLVTKNGSNAFGDVVLGEFVLEPGENNVVIGGSGINVDIRIKYRDRFM